MWNASVKSLDDGNTSLRTDRMNGKTVLGDRIPHTAPLDVTIDRAGWQWNERILRARGPGIHSCCREKQRDYHVADRPRPSSKSCTAEKPLSSQHGNSPRRTERQRKKTADFTSMLRPVPFTGRGRQRLRRRDHGEAHGGGSDDVAARFRVVRRAETQRPIVAIFRQWAHRLGNWLTVWILRHSLRKRVHLLGRTYGAGRQSSTKPRDRYRGWPTFRASQLASQPKQLAGEQGKSV